MAYKGKRLTNEKTGQSIEFVTTSDDSDGLMLEMISTYQPHSKEPLQHYHPVQDEYFKVVAGELTVKLKDKTFVLKKGDGIHLPPYTSHSMWNNSDTTTVVQWKVTPALKTEYFMETTMGLAMDNKTKRNGMPGLLQISVIASKHHREFRLMKPSYCIQKILFALLKPIALLAGKKPYYRQYID